MNKALRFTAWEVGREIPKVYSFAEYVVLSGWNGCCCQPASFRTKQNLCHGILLTADLARGIGWAFSGHLPNAYVAALGPKNKPLTIWAKRNRVNCAIT